MTSDQVTIFSIVCVEYKGTCNMCTYFVKQKSIKYIFWTSVEESSFNTGKVGGQENWCMTIFLSWG